MTDGFVTANEEEDEKDASGGVAAVLEDTVEAAKDLAADMKGNLKRFKTKAKTELEEAADRVDEDGARDGEEAEGGDLRARLPKGGKVDVSYV